MRSFFKSAAFKLILTIVTILLLLLAYTKIFPDNNFIESGISYITVHFQRGVAWVFDKSGDYAHEFREKEDEDFVFVKSIVEGTSNNKSQNVRRMISLLFSRTFNYMESTNPETFMFMDYSPEEKEQIILECKQYDKSINKKKPNKKVKDEEENR